MKNIIFKLILIFFKNHDIQDLINIGFRQVLRFFFFQKILGFNRKTNWLVHRTSSVSSPEKIKVQNGFRGFSKYCFFDGRNGIIIGENVWIGSCVKIISQNHEVDDYYNYKESYPIVIGKNCWIGAGSIILPNVKLGDHTIVGAGSVVTKSFTDKDQVVAGNPAKVVKKLKPYK